jgi:beta-carotene/zeaxanthin 4-ketolase
MGLVWAITILTTWAASLGFCLGLDVMQIDPLGIVLAILFRTFLHTGLFVTAHDAMHNSLSPSHPKLNQGIGQFILGLYAFLSYNRSYTNHWKHHRHPTEIDDPDFHSEHQPHVVSWYIKFMLEYLTLTQLLVFLLGWAVIFYVVYPVYPVENILLFWILPLVLSSMQLFYFGTYLPHRNLAHSLHCARSTDYPSWLSFLTCYHFGYHSEHHEYPELPWYQLPTVHFKQRHLLIGHSNASQRDGLVGN